MPDPCLLKQQIDYYCARAAEYDEWWFRTGRYDQGAERNAEWLRDVAALEAELTAANPCGDILEIACGTGLWTRYLAPRARRITAIDAAPETIALNRARVNSPNVDYVEGDIFAWLPDRRYDFVFFGFWISHVPRARWDSFWTTVERAIAPGGTVFFVDNQPHAYRDMSGRSRLADDTLEERTLNDGRKFAIVKNFFEPVALQAELAGRGWTGYVRESETFFLYGSLRRARSG